MRRAARAGLFAVAAALVTAAALGLVAYALAPRLLDAPDAAVYTDAVAYAPGAPVAVHAADPLRTLIVTDAAGRRVANRPTGQQANRPTGQQANRPMAD